jgi:hypothetical protein
MNFNLRRAQSRRFSINPFGGHREFLSDPEIPKAFEISGLWFHIRLLFFIELLTVRLTATRCD